MKSRKNFKKIDKMAIRIDDALNFSLHKNIRGIVEFRESMKNVEKVQKRVLLRILKKNSGYDPIVHICSSSEVYGQVKEEDIPIQISTFKRI